jgi:hypothetical protein
MTRQSWVAVGLFVFGFLVCLYLILNLFQRQTVLPFANTTMDIPTQRMQVDCPKVAGSGDEIALDINFTNPLDRRQFYSVTVNDGDGWSVSAFITYLAPHETEHRTLSNHPLITTSTPSWIVYALARTDRVDSWESSFVGTCATWIIDFAGLRGMSVVIALSIFSIASMAMGIIVGWRRHRHWLSFLQGIVIIGLLASVVLLLVH